MKKSLSIITITGILFVSTLGTLMHFVYQWSGENFLVGLIAPVNESTWEHMKLAFFPTLLYVLLEPLVLRKYVNLLFAHSPYEHIAFYTLSGITILTGTWMIPVLFYTYQGILGFTLMPLDIATFFISIIFAFWLRYRLLRQDSCLSERQKKLESCSSFVLIAIIIMCIAFFLFTYIPPNLGLFQEP